MRSALIAIGGWALKTFDARDAMLAAGLVLLATGLWNISAPAALIVPGAIITGVAIFGSRINGNNTNAGEE